MPAEPRVLVVFLVVFVVVLLLALVWAVHSLWTVSRSLKTLTKTLDNLNVRVSEQERQLAEVREEMDRKGSDIFSPFIEALQQLKSRGWTAALSLIGSHVFRSYLGKRRQKALPRKDNGRKENESI